MLEIPDNGPGINDMNEALGKNTLGLSLIFDLARQINARIEYSNKSGSRFMICFDSNKFPSNQKCEQANII